MVGCGSIRDGCAGFPSLVGICSVWMSCLMAMRADVFDVGPLGLLSVVWW